MDLLFNLTAVKGRMDDPPKGQRIHNFFDGATIQLKRAQILNIKNIIKSHAEEVEEYLDMVLENCPEDEEVSND